MEQHLSQHPDHLRAWASHLMNPQITDVFKSLVLEYKNRSEDTVKKITSLL